MTPDHLERRLDRALGEAASGLPVSAARLDAVVAHGARRRRWARAGAAVSSIAAASIVAVASAWALGVGDPPPAGGVTGEAPREVVVSTTAVDTDVVVGTAPPTTSITGESDETVGTVPDPATTTPPRGDATVGTAPPTTSITGESDETVGTVPGSATTTAPPDTTVAMSPPTTRDPTALPACPVFGEPTDDFGAARNGDVTRGIDIFAPRGAPVLAVAAGSVDIGADADIGNALDLTGDDGTIYRYQHLDSYAGGIGDNVRVEAGQELGSVGITGDAGGVPHLHFQIWQAGMAVDPYPGVHHACR